MIFAIIGILLSIGITIFSGSSAIGFSFIFFYMTGWAISNKLGSSAFERRAILKVLLITLPVYISFSFITYLGYLQHGDFFIYSDQSHFFSVGDTLGKENSIIDIFRLCFIERAHFDQEAAYFIFGIIAYFAETFFDGNSILLQSLFIGFLATLINLYIYKILRYYLDSSTTFRYTIYYAFLSPLIYYSPWLLRDIHIAFLFAIGIHLIHTKFSFKNLFYFIPITVVIMQLRMDTGLFFVVFPLLYVFNAKKESAIVAKLWPFIISVCAILSVWTIVYLLPEFEKTLESMSKYAIYTAESMTDGLAAVLYKLPPGLKQISIVIHSQFTPLPPWIGLTLAENIFEGVAGIVMMVTTVYWSFIFIYLIYSLMDKSIRSYLSKFSLILLIIVLVFCVLQTTNMNVRRIMYMYPILFAIYAYLRSLTPKVMQASIALNSARTYALLLVFYVILKIFI